MAKRAKSRRITRRYYDRLLLKPEMIPRPLWRRSVASKLDRATWRSIRGKVSAAAGGRCQICGASYEKGMICHEKWLYNDSQHTATLTSFQLICRDCSSIIHWGRTVIWLVEGQAMGSRQESIDNLIAKKRSHLQAVNRMASEDLDQLFDYAGLLHHRRSEQKWRVRILPALRRTFSELKGLRL
jgi:hypothetical protein